eukprot:6316526-Amphidinium_carterae.1
MSCVGLTPTSSGSNNRNHNQVAKATMSFVVRLLACKRFEWSAVDLLLSFFRLTSCALQQFWSSLVDAESCINAELSRIV